MTALAMFRGWVDRPVNGLLFVAIILVCYFAYFAIPALMESNAFGRGAVESGLLPFLEQLPAEAGLALSILLIIAVLGWWQECRITTSPIPVGMWALVVPVLFVGSLISVSILALLGGAQMDPAPSFDLWARVALFVLLVGIFEEVLFRGVVFHAIERVGGAIWALILSSLLFGAMHYVNWISGQPLEATTVQVLHAAGGGFLYGALMLRAGSIWPGILLHGLWDLSVGMTTATFNTDEPASLDATAASDSMPSTILGQIGEVLLLGNEPIYGLIVLLLWLRRRRRTSAAAN